MASFAQMRARAKKTGPLAPKEDQVANDAPIPVNAVLDVKCFYSAMQPTKAGGQRLRLGLEVVAGEHKGKSFYTSLNLDCPTSEKAEAIAWIELERISLAMGFDDVVADLDDLKGKIAECKILKHDEWNGEVRPEPGVWKKTTYVDYGQDDEPAKSSGDRFGQDTFTDSDIPF